MKNIKFNQTLLTIILMALTWFLTKKFGATDLTHKAIAQVNKLKGQLDTAQTYVIQLKADNAAKDTIIGKYYNQISQLDSANQGMLLDIIEDTEADSNLCPEQLPPVDGEGL